jgi:site-specific recombinase
VNRHTANTITDEALDELYRRIDTLEHVAAGNRRHVQLIVPDLQRAEAALDRVRKLADVWQDAPDPLARAMAADLHSTLRSPAHDGPTTAECATDDRRWWGGEKAGE